ncbi:MAG: hypothetical protein ACRDI2_23265 [Chloroflexota bacterium]
MAQTSTEGPSAPPITPRAGDPARPRYLGLWVAGILLVSLFGGAMGVVTDVLFRLAIGQ